MYTIAKAKEAVKNGIKGYLLKDSEGNYVMKEVNRLPFYLEGEPGIGKTEIVRQIATELNIGYVSFSLVHHTRNSLLGLPVIKELESGDKYTCYTMSEIIAKVLESVEAGHKEGVLLLDEFPCMSESIMPTMLAFLQTKNIGQHHLPEGWVIVLCGNPTKYNKSSRVFDAAIIDRLRKLDIQFEAKAFMDYGMEIHLHQSILEFLNMSSNQIYLYEKKEEDTELVTCRGWENLSHMLYSYEALGQSVDAQDIKQYIKSEKVSADFYRYYMQYSLGMKEKDIHNILKGVRMNGYVKAAKTRSMSEKYRILERLWMTFMNKNEEYNKKQDKLGLVMKFGLALEEALKEPEQFNFARGSYSFCIKQLRKKEWYDIYDDIFDEWMSWAEKKDHKISSLTEVNVLNMYKEWQADSGYNLNKLEQRAVEMLNHMFQFVSMADEDGSMMEALLQRVNHSVMALRLLNRYPNEIYKKECCKRYAV